MDQLSDIAKNAKHWRKILESYDKAVISTAQAASEIFSVKTVEDINEQTTKSFEQSFKKMIRINKKLEIALGKLALSILAVEDKNIRDRMFQLIQTPADYAGLDDKVMKSINENNANLTSVCDIHEIFIEHCRIISDKLIRFAEC